MRFLSLITLLLLIDLATKHTFRFYDTSLNLPFVFFEGYLTIEEMTLNYGNAYSSASTAAEASLLNTIIIYLGSALGMGGATWLLINREDSASTISTLPCVAMLAGGLGNTIERLIYGNVCDWITLTRPDSDHYLVMNLADLLLWIGLLGLSLTITASHRFRIVWFIFSLMWVSWPLADLMFD